MIITVQPIEHLVDGLVLRGTRYLPAGTGPWPTVVLHHGFGGQRTEGFRSFVQLARALVAEGFAVVAMDRAGQGESDGDFAEVSVERDIRDATTLLTWVAAMEEVDAEDLHLVGLSMGAVVASVVAAETELPVRSLTFWSVAAVFVDELRGGHLQGVSTATVREDGFFDFYGQRIGAAFFDEATTFDVYGRARGYSGPVRVLHGDQDFVPVRYAEGYRQVYGDAMDLTIVPGADHGWASVPARDLVIGETVRFAAAHARGSQQVEPSVSRARGPQLITYADRLGGDFTGVAQLLRGPLAGAFEGVHVLPFFHPVDGADAGFDPVDHATVDPRLGTWEDVAALASDHVLMADLIVNHVSSDSEQFQDVVQHGRASRWAEMFLTMDTVFPDGATEEDLAAIYRPRPGLPFTAMVLGGERRLVWTTFTPEQVDLDLRSPVAWEYLHRVIDRQTSAGVSMLRLDAVGYTAKVPGTSCFMVDEAEQIVAKIRDHARRRGASVLLEIHGHHEQQIRAARTVDHVYDFALPPLVLHAFAAGDVEPLDRWLTIRPANAVTVLDTHDGIGIIDVGRGAEGEAGLLEDEQIDHLVEWIHEQSDGGSRKATGGAASNLDLYQVNCTFYDALGSDDHRYLLARIVQLFVPGIPQVYYVGLLAGSNDLELLARTGVGRDINRHHYTPEEIGEALGRPVVQRQLAALRLRATHPAFDGELSHHVEGSVLHLTWQSGAHRAVLRADVVARTSVVGATDEHGSLHEVPIEDVHALLTRVG